MLEKEWKMMNDMHTTEIVRDEDCVENVAL